MANLKKKKTPYACGALFGTLSASVEIVRSTPNCAG